MDSQTLARLNDLRSRVIEARTLRGEKKPVPEGLMPSDEELRESLKAIREDRAGSIKAAASRKSSAAPANIPDNLNDLFD